MKFSQWISLCALLAASLILWSLREIIIQIFAAIVIAMALCTLTGLIRSQSKLPRPFALAICIVTLLTIIALAFIIVVPQFTDEFQQLIIQLPDAAIKLWKLGLAFFNKTGDMIYGSYAKEILGERILITDINPFPDSTSLANGVGDGIKKILGVAGDLGSGMLQVLFVFAMSLMIAFQPYSYKEVVILLVPSFYRKRARIILSKCGESLSNWMGGVLISSLCVSVLAGIGLSLLGIKLVIANALLAGMLNVVPNVGPVISTIFPISVALLDEPWKVLPVIGLYVFIQNLESYLITPSVMHYQVKLLPGLTLIAQFTFTVIFGPIGLLLALPLAVVLQVLIKEVIITDILDLWKKKRIIGN